MASPDRSRHLSALPRNIAILLFFGFSLAASACSKEKKDAPQPSKAPAPVALVTAPPSPPSSEAAKEKNQAPQKISRYDVPEFSPKELKAAYQSTCKAASGRPILVEFSAPWCGDCRKLHSMKKEDILKKELNEWPALTVNIGNFDQHEELLQRFSVKAIARWLIINPKDCDSDITKWPALASRTLEPLGKDRRVTPALLAQWLKKNRE